MMKGKHLGTLVVVIRDPSRYLNRSPLTSCVELGKQLGGGGGSASGLKLLCTK